MFDFNNELDFIKLKTIRNFEININSTKDYMPISFSLSGILNEDTLNEVALILNSYYYKIKERNRILNTGKEIPNNLLDTIILSLKY